MYNLYLSVVNLSAIYREWDTIVMYRYCILILSALTLDVI